jgi:uncharacterized membrane protein
MLSSRRNAIFSKIDVLEKSNKNHRFLIHFWKENPSKFDENVSNFEVSFGRPNSTNNWTSKGGVTLIGPQISGRADPYYARYIIYIITILLYYYIIYWSTISCDQIYTPRGLEASADLHVFWNFDF